jgi:hypothetical protein
LKVLLVTSRYPWPPRRGDQLRAAQMIELLAGEHEITLLAPEQGRRPAWGSGREEMGKEAQRQQGGKPQSSAPYLGTAGLGTPDSGEPNFGTPDFGETYLAPDFAAPDPRVRVERYRGAGWPGAVLGVVRAAARGLPVQSGLFHQPDLGRRLRRLAPAADLVVLQLARLASHAGDVGATPLLVDLVDSLALNLERRAAVDRAWLRPALRFEAALLARAERRLAERAAGVLVVAARDRAALAGRLPPALAERLHVVPLALDPEPAGWDGEEVVPPGQAASRAAQVAAPGDRAAARDAQAAERAAQEAAPGGEAAAPEGLQTGAAPLLGFTGNLGYFVNADALTWFLREVWPALRARRPQLRLVAAGDRPSRAVRRAVARLGAASGVTLLASPADLRPVLAAATIAIAPLRAGSGVPLKILEAWCAGVPVVASPWAAAGTTAHPGDDLRVAVAPAEWVETLLDLLDHPAERHRLAGNARSRLTADYSRAVARERWMAALSAVCVRP